MVLGLVVRYWDSQAIQLAQYYKSQGFQVYIVAHESAKSCVKDNGNDVLWMTDKWCESQKLNRITLDQLYDDYIHYACVRLCRHVMEQPHVNHILVVRDDALVRQSPHDKKTLASLDFYVPATLKKTLFLSTKLLDFNPRVILVSRSGFADFSAMICEHPQLNTVDIVGAYLKKNESLYDHIAHSAVSVTDETTDLFDVLYQPSGMSSVGVDVYTKVIDLISSDPWVWVREGVKAKGMIFPYGKEPHISKRHAFFKMIDLVQKEMQVNYNHALAALIKAVAFLERVSKENTAQK